MRALSIQQPWANFIARGFAVMKAVDNGDGTSRVELAGVAFKDVENRAKPTTYRGRVAIHASTRPAPFEPTLKQCMDMGIAPMSVLLYYSTDRQIVPRGALIGEVDIVDCVTESDSPWFTGPYGWILANPQPYDTPIPYKGKLGFFEIPEHPAGRER